MSDAQQLFDWANDPDVRAMSINSNRINWEEHLTWFKKKLESPLCKIFILEQSHTPVGQIRYEKLDGVWVVDYSIGKNFRGSGLGRTILEQSIPLFKSEVIVAVVKKSNAASNKIFISLGFIMDEEKTIDGTDYLQYLFQV